MIRHWDGTRWRLSYRAPARASLLDLDAIATDDVWAVGSIAVAGGGNAFAVHWDGTAWMQSTLPPTPPGYPQVSYVSSISSDQVLAYGYSEDGEALHPFSFWWDGTSWTAPTGVLADLTLIDADGPHDAWGIGYSGTFNFFTAHWNGHQWEQVPLGKVPDHELDSVSAISPDDVWLTGVGDSGSFTAHWSGKRWAIVPAGLPQDQTVYMTVDATAPDDVWLAGTNVTAHKAVLEHWDGLAWSPVDDPGSQHANGTMPDVSAVSSTDVWATGSWLDADGISHRVLENWDGATWTEYHHA